MHKKEPSKEYEEEKEESNRLQHQKGMKDQVCQTNTHAQTNTR